MTHTIKGKTAGHRPFLISSFLNVTPDWEHRNAAFLSQGGGVRDITLTVAWIPS